MSYSTTAANETAATTRGIAQSVSTFIQTVTEAVEEIDEVPEAVVEEIEASGEAVVEDVADLEDEVAELRERSEDAARDRAETKGRVTTLEEAEDADDTDATPTPNGGETTRQDADQTPVERLARANDVTDVTDSVSVERAVSLFKNLPNWGSKTPKGIVLKPSDNPLSLLEADRDESLAWKQYYRAAETLERLSQGAVTFFDSDRHGKMLVLHEQSEAYDRVVSGALSSSSVEATT